MSLNKALEEAARTIPECLASGYVDMTSGMLLGIQTLDSHPQEVLDLVSAATSDLFQGDTVVEVERIFKQSRGVKDDGHHYFQEILIFSDNLIHVFIRAKKYPDHVVVFVTRKSANVGMVLAKSRIALDKITDAV